MKRSMLLLNVIGLFLAILSSSAVGGQDLDADGGNFEVDNALEDIPNDEDYILLDDEYEEDDQNVGGDDDDDTLDIRSVPADDLMSLSDDVLRDDFEKRSWKYKCEPRECNARCLALLNLPQGTCGFKGKCYCKREK